MSGLVRVAWLLLAAILLEAAVLCAQQLEGAAPRKPDEAPAQAQVPIGGNALAGFGLLVRSPYLGGIALWVLLLSLCGTVLYFQQANIVAAASDEPAVRTRIFASIDLAAGLLTLLIQTAATGRLMTRFGVGAAAGFLPLVFAIGFAALAVSPVLLLVIGFQAVQRTANFAIWPRGSGRRHACIVVSAHAAHFAPTSDVDDAKPTDCGLPCGPRYIVIVTFFGGRGSGRSATSGSAFGAGFGGFGAFFAFFTGFFGAGPSGQSSSCAC